MEGLGPQFHKKVSSRRMTIMSEGDIRRKRERNSVCERGKKTHISASVSICQCEEEKGGLHQKRGERRGDCDPERDRERSRL